MSVTAEHYRRTRRGLICIVLWAIANMTPTATAQKTDRGWYAGLQVGIGVSTPLSVSRTYLSHPTRCDVLLYAPPLRPPVDDPACLDNTYRSASNEFDLGNGPIGGVMVGYVMRSMRFELEYLNASFGSDESLVASTSFGVEETQLTEWSLDFPPSEWVGDHSMHQVFMNVYWDYRSDRHWTPFVGAGAGRAGVLMNYFLQFVRKPEEVYLQIPFNPDWPDEAKRRAAGTATILDTYPDRWVFGYQLLAGTDRALSESTSVGTVARWVKLLSIDHDAPYLVVRSHQPVQAGGESSTSNHLVFSDIGYLAVTVHLKYHF